MASSRAAVGPIGNQTTVQGGRGDHHESNFLDTDARSDNASLADHVLEKPNPDTRVTKRQRFKNHCGRLWLWYLISTVILTAILLPILFKIIIPAIVQSIVNQQAVPVNGGKLIVVSPNQLEISLDTTLNTPLPVKIDPIQLNLYNKNTTEYAPFVQLTLPEQHVNHETKASVVNQTVTILDEPELIKWLNHVIDAPSADLSLRGDLSVHLGQLTATPKMDTTISIAGLNELRGFGITHLDMRLFSDDKGNNIKGTLNLPNYSKLTLFFGDLTLNLMVAGYNIGFVTVYDVMLPPGNNSLKFDGQLHLNTLITHLGPILASQAVSLKDGQIQLNTTGNATMVNGQHIKFIEAVLNKKVLTFNVSVVSLMTDLVSGLLPGGGSSKGGIGGIVSEVFGNSTLMQNILHHWDPVHKSTSITASGKDKDNKAARALQGSLMWELLKLKMKAKKGLI